MDMKISGRGQIASGEYENIKISGSGTLAGFVRCQSLTISGSGSGEEIECNGELKVSGSCGLSKSVSASGLKVSGSFSCNGNLLVNEELKCSGSVKCGGSIRCTNLSASGSVSANGDIDGETVNVSGKIDCGGLLNAEEIIIRIGGPMKIGSIGGSKITVRKNDKNGDYGFSQAFFMHKRNYGSEVTVGNSVEGDEIFLECVKAPRVSGRIVSIGDDCEIKVVQYSESIEISPKAKVGTTEKL